MYHCCFLYFTTAVFLYFLSVITVRRKPCTTAVGTPVTAASSVNRNTGIVNTSACVDVNATKTGRTRIYHLHHGVLYSHPT